MKQSWQHRFTYIMETNFPEFTTAGARVVDEHLQRAMVHVWGVNLWSEEETSRGERQVWGDFVPTRATLPCKYGGAGVDRTTSFVHTAFVSTVTHCISQFFSVTSSDSSKRQTGLFEHLRPEFGLGDSESFDEDRRQEAVRTWLQSSAASEDSIGKRYADAWDAIKEKGAQVGAERLSKGDMQAILAGTVHMPRPTADGEASGSDGDGEESKEEEGDDAEGGDGDSTSSASGNPFAWDVEELITHRRKLQWRVRQTLARASWLGLHQRIEGMTTKPEGGWPGSSREERKRAKKQATKRRKDRRFMAFVNVNHFSRAPLIGMSSFARLRSDEFRESVAHYFGLASPACRVLAGKEVKRGTNKAFHVKCDPEGVNLITAANGIGGLRINTLHNCMEAGVAYLAGRAKVTARRGFVIDTATALSASNWQREPIAAASAGDDDEDEEEDGNNVRSGDTEGEIDALHIPSEIRPDLLLGFENRDEMPEAIRPPSGGVEILGEVKTEGLRKDSQYTKTASYKDRRATHETESLAVRARANKVLREYEKKAARCDRRYVEADEENGAAPSGPYARTLGLYGPVVPIVMGAFGEMSREMDTLIGCFAEKRAAETCRKSGLTTPEAQLAARYRRWMVQLMGNLGARGIARVKLQIASESVPLRWATKKSRAVRNEELELQRVLEPRARFSEGFL